MKKSNSLANRSGFMGFILFVLVTTFGISSCKPDFDLDKRFPEWLGTSIFETLDKGFEGDSGKVYKFTYFVRLIQDLDQEKILAKTGSKTLFVADDEAFERFFGPNCPFMKADNTPVTSYEELSEAQKQMILKGSMLNNVYQVAMLSSSEGPTIGDCMRRLTSSSIYDTVPVLLPKDMPVYSELWNNAKTKEAGIPIMQDGTVRPMVLFVNKFLTSRKMTDDDYDFLFNQGRYDKTGKKPARNPADASVNGVRIEFQNKKCFNGFIHVMEDVIYLLPNMAEYLARKDSKATIYSSIVDRFSAPFYPTEEHKTEIKRLLSEKIIVSPALSAAMAASKDSVYTKMYLAKRSQGDKKNNKLPSGLYTSDKKNTLPDDELLRFDPGWNGFFSQTSSTTTTNVAMQQNMSVMMVPTDSTLRMWWLTGAGKALREMYHDPELWGNTNLSYEEVAKDMSFIPRSVIVKLVNNNMLNSLTGSVPSKFGNVLNDANDPMFEKPDSAANTIESVVMCCNGAIYFTTAVYAPTAYRSVSYPALVNPKLKIIDAAIQDEVLSFSAYLNSMVATYSFFVPLVKDTADVNLNGKLVWIDPVSFGTKKYGSTGTAGQYLKAMVFSYNAGSANAFKVEAEIYNYNDSTNTLLNKVGSTITDADVIRDRLEDLMDYHIILDNVEGDSDGQNVPWDDNGYAYFKTKGRGVVRFKKGVENPSAVDATNQAAYSEMLSKMEVAGGWQIETGEKINIVDRIDLSRKSSSNGNGRTYIIDRPLATSRMSVYDILSDSINYPEFRSFFKLMESAVGSDGKPLFDSQTNKHEIGGRKAVTTFNTYHYTVYVPTNDAIDALIANKTILTPQDINAITTSYKNYLSQLQSAYGKNKGDSLYADSLIHLSMSLRHAVPGSLPTPKDSAFKLANYTDSLKNQLKDFIRYHIQDNSVYCNQEFKAGYDEQGNTATIANYETAYMNRNQQFVKLEVKGGKDITIKDAGGNTRHVVKGTSATGKPLFNIMCREYEYNKSAVSNVGDTQLETSSYVVIHQIDGALCNGDVVF